MINPIVFSNAAKVNCKAVDAKHSNAKHFDLPCAKNLASQASDSFVKRDAVKGPVCGVDCSSL